MVFFCSLNLFFKVSLLHRNAPSLIYSLGTTVLPKEINRVKIRSSCGGAFLGCPGRVAALICRVCRGRFGPLVGVCTCCIPSSICPAYYSGTMVLICFFPRQHNPFLLQGELLHNIIFNFFFDDDCPALLLSCGFTPFALEPTLSIFFLPPPCPRWFAREVFLCPLKGPAWPSLPT